MAEERTIKILGIPLPLILMVITILLPMVVLYYLGFRQVQDLRTEVRVMTIRLAATPEPTPEILQGVSDDIEVSPTLSPTPTPRQTVKRVVTPVPVIEVPPSE